MNKPFQDLMEDDSTRKNSIGSCTFSPSIELMFAEWDNAKPPLRQKVKADLRKQLLGQIADFSAEKCMQYIVELQLKLKQNEMRNAKRIQSITNEKERHAQNLQDIWSNERVKWQHQMQVLRTENELLQNGFSGDCTQRTISPKCSEEIVPTQVTEPPITPKVVPMIDKQTQVNMDQPNVLKEKIVELESNVACISKKYTEAMQLKKKYFNQVQDLKGNIRVIARSRPILPMDGDDQRSSINIFDEKTLEIENEKGSHLFQFDKIFDGSSEQKDVYENVSPLIESVMDGYKCCIFAYGQTGSGKTYTMQGDEKNPGVNVRALQHLFRVAHERKPAFDYKITVSVIEIYNEKIKDLLVNNQKEYKIRQNVDGGNYIENVSIHEVSSKKDVQKLMKKGAKNRTMASTNSNETSSRSHMILTINVIGSNEAAKVTYSGKLHLIDLAGCERTKVSGVVGDQLKEASNINRSLSNLGNVISALSKKKNHVPFRNSTLTHLLQDSLGGNAKMLMFTNISPAKTHYGETLCALKFAQRAKTVEMGQSKRTIIYHRKSAKSRFSKDKNRFVGNKRVSM